MEYHQTFQTYLSNRVRVETPFVSLTDNLAWHLLLVVLASEPESRLAEEVIHLECSTSDPSLERHLAFDRV